MAVMGAQSACQQTFLALGEAKISMFLACLRKVILLFPLALILPHIASSGVWGLLTAEPISDVIAATCTTTMFYLRSKKILKQDK
jgi:Na+-driven multidrug efflux pump